jgi:hypothetical protein
MINPFDEEVRSLEISPTPSYSDSEEEINNAYEESIKEMADIANNLTATLKDIA